MPFDLRQLRYALAAHEHGSFRRAAEILRLKQSSLSRRIMLMEGQIGLTIFERSRKGVRPTAVGAAFLASAQKLIDQAEQLAATTLAVSRGEAGSLTIGFYTSLSAGNLRVTLLEYRKRHPNVDMKIVQNSRDRLLADVRNGSIDIAITTGEPVKPTGDTMALWSERVLVAFLEHHLLASDDVVGWSDLRAETFLLGHRDPGQDFHDLLIGNLASPGSPPTIIHHDVDSDAIRCLVSAGFGVTLLSESGAGVNYPGIQYREIHDGTGLSRIGYSAHWAKTPKNPALKPFLKLLEERYPILGNSG